MLPSELNPMPFESSGVPEKYMKKAELELNETPERRVQAIKELRELVAADKLLEVLIEQKNEYYLMFLRAKKFDVRRAYENLKYYINYQKRFNFLFIDHSSEELLRTGAVEWVTFPPYRCPDGCAILVCKMVNWNASVTSLKDLQRFFTFFLLTSINDPMTQINGYKVIMDFRGNYMQYMRCITPTSIYIVFNGTVNCLPARYKQIHVVYPQMAFKICYTLAKPFLPEKLKSRVFLHDKCDTLLQHFPKEVLPEEYGGSIKEYSNREWIRKNSSPDMLNQLFLKCTKY